MHTHRHTHMHAFHTHTFHKCTWLHMVGWCFWVVVSIMAVINHWPVRLQRVYRVWCFKTTHLIRKLHYWEPEEGSGRCNSVWVTFYPPFSAAPALLYPYSLSHGKKGYEKHEMSLGGPAGTWLQRDCCSWQKKCLPALLWHCCCVLLEEPEEWLIYWPGVLLECACACVSLCLCLCAFVCLDVCVCVCVCAWK